MSTVLPPPPTSKASPPPAATKPAATLVPPSTEAAPAPSDAPLVPSGKMVVRVKGTKDTTSKVLSKLLRSSPRESGDMTVKAMTSFTRSRDSVLASVKYVITTGIPSFDRATGGVPFGKVIELYGLDSCGKTAMTFLLCGRAKFGHVYKYENGKHVPLGEPFEVTVVYLDNENSLQEGERMKVDGEEVDAIVGECDTIDQIFKTIEDAAAEIKKVEGETKVKQFLVVAVDTIAGTSTEQERKQAWGSQDYQRQPKMLRDGFRQVVRFLKEANVCVICTNQVSDSFKPKTPGAPQNRSPLPQEQDFSSFGGKALRYYAWMRVWFCKVPSVYKLSKSHKFPDGHHIHFYTAKNRHLMPLRSGRMVLLFQNAKCKAVSPEHANLSLDKFREIYPGGYSPQYSILEHLVYMGFATYGTSGGYRINFKKHGVSVKNDASLQEQDDEEYLDIESRQAWPAFYAAHQVAVDALFDKCIESMFNQNVAELEAEDGDLDELDGEVPE